MKNQAFWSFYGIYAPVVLTLASIALAVDRDYVVRNWIAAVILSILALFLPFIAVITARIKGSFAKKIRPIMYLIFKVDVLVKAILLLAFVSSISLLAVLTSGTIQIVYIVVGILILNLSFIVLLILILNGRFQTRQPNALLIRKRGTAEVYLYDSGNIRWIPDPQTLHLLGYRFEDIVDVDEAEFNAYTKRASIESITRARIIRTANRPGVWMVFGEFRKLIPDDTTLAYIQHLNQRNIEDVIETEFQGLVEYSPLPSIVLIK